MRPCCAARPWHSWARVERWIRRRRGVRRDPPTGVLVGGNAGLEVAVAPTGTPAPRAGGRAELAIYVVNRGGPIEFALLLRPAAD